MPDRMTTHGNVQQETPTGSHDTAGGMSISSPVTRLTQESSWSSTTLLYNPLLYFEAELAIDRSLGIAIGVK